MLDLGPEGTGALLLQAQMDLRSEEDLANMLNGESKLQSFNLVY